MADNISRVFLFTFCLVLATTACVKTATSTAPADPPQVTVLKYVQLGATADNTAAHVLVTLCAAQSGRVRVLKSRAGGHTDDVTSIAERPGPSASPSATDSSTP